MPMLFDPGACCDCSSGSTVCQTIQFLLCGHAIGSGYSVVARRTSDGSTLDAGTTGSDGKVTLCVPSGVSNSVVLSYDSPWGDQTYSGITNPPATRQVAIANDASVTGLCCDGGEWVCSGGIYVYPSRLYITDINGTWASDSTGCGSLSFSAPAGFLADLYDTDPGTGLCVKTPGGGLYRYQYSVGIITSGVNKGYRVIRTCGVALDGTASNCAARNPTFEGFFGRSGSCPDILLSGGLTPTSADADPVGGTVVLSS